MRKLFLTVVVLTIASAACQAAPPPALPPAAAAATPVSPTAAASPPPATVQPSAAPTVDPAPPAGAQLAIDKDFKDPAEPWCKNSGSYDFGDFYCEGDGFHLVPKGWNVATNQEGAFRNFIAEATMRITAESAGERSGDPVAFLGVTYELVTPAVAAREGITATAGDLLTGVSPDSPAALAGLRSGDVVTAVDGTPVEATNDLSARVAQAEVGDELSLTVVRGTARESAGTRELKVRLGERTPEKWGSYGVAFRSSHVKTAFYVFEVTPAGEYRLGIFTVPGWTELIPWTYSPAIRQGGDVSNTLKVVARGDNLALFANDQQLVTIQDNTSPQGAAGPIALEEAHAVVDTFKVWELP